MSNRNGNRQAPQLDPALARALIAGQQPATPDGFGHMHGQPTPCQQVQGIHFLNGKTVQFFTTGGLTCFEAECMKMAATLASKGFDSDYVAMEAVAIVRGVLERCREVEGEPYQGRKLPPPEDAVPE